MSLPGIVGPIRLSWMHVGGHPNPPQEHGGLDCATRGWSSVSIDCASNLRMTCRPSSSDSVSLSHDHGSGRNLCARRRLLTGPGVGCLSDPDPSQTVLGVHAQEPTPHDTQNNTQYGANLPSPGAPLNTSSSSVVPG